MDPITIIILVVVLILSLIGPLFSKSVRHKVLLSEGSECNPLTDYEDDNADEYTIQLDEDDKKVCKVSTCKSGYERSGDGCVAEPTFTDGEACTPTDTDEIENGTDYTYNSVGECFASACEDGYTLNDNECILDKTFIEYEHFIGGITPDLENSNTFAIFLSDFAGYDTNTVTLGNNIETFSNIFDDTFFAHYFIDGEPEVLILTAPLNTVPVNKYNPAGKSVNPGLSTTAIRATYNFFKVEPAEIEGHDDIYYIKTDDPSREHNGEVVYRSTDVNRPADKYIKFQNDRFEYVDTIDDASLFRQKTRETDLTLPENVELPEEVDTKTYFVRVEEDITGGDE